MEEKKKKMATWKKAVIIVLVIFFLAIIIPFAIIVVRLMGVIYGWFSINTDNFETVQELQTVMPDDFYYFDFEEITTPTSYTRYKASTPRISDKRYNSGRFKYERYLVEIIERKTDGGIIKKTTIEAVKPTTRIEKETYRLIFDEFEKKIIDGVPCAIKGGEVFFFIDDLWYIIDRVCKTEEEELAFVADVEALISSRYLIDETNN